MRWNPAGDKVEADRSQETVETREHGARRFGTGLIVLPRRRNLWVTDTLQ